LSSGFVERSWERKEKEKRRGEERRGEERRRRFKLISSLINLHQQGL